jgi:hypothetical protein
MDHDAQSLGPAKFCVKKPAGAIFRSDTTGASSVSCRLLFSLFAWSPSAAAIASGLDTHPPGSAGKLSRPATVKLLTFPPARAAQR